MEGDILRTTVTSAKVKKVDSFQGLWLAYWAGQADSRIPFVMGSMCHHCTAGSWPEVFVLSGYL